MIKEVTYLYAECNDCGAPFDPHEVGGPAHYKDKAKLEKSLREAEWGIWPDGVVKCPGCFEKMKFIVPFNNGMGWK